MERETERRFFPERQRLRHLLEQFLASTAALPDENSFWAKLRKLLQEGLGIESVKPLLKDGGGEGWVDKDGDPVPLQPGGRLEETLEEESRTVMVDEALAADPPVLSPEETEWLGQDSVSLLVALRRGEELGGALLLTWSNRREHLGAADLRLLASLSDQIALQHENLRLRAAASGVPHPLSSRSEPA